MEALRSKELKVKMTSHQARGGLYSKNLILHPSLQ